MVPVLCFREQDQLLIISNFGCFLVLSWEDEESQLVEF
uniref:CNH domain-containing protein n=1 Tax=Anguilla anguilla TaxID=7936 RepID=A0A0E9WEB4_ANGAN